MLKQLVPGWLKTEIKARRRASAARTFRAERKKATLAGTVEAVCDGKLDFCAGQRPNEIRRLLELLQRENVTLMGEIGAASGGNLFLFSQAISPTAEIVSLELDYTPERRRAYPQLIEPGQKLVCVGGDSHRRETLERVKAALAGRQFDFLFIDGDHSLEGVRADYEMYAPLVKRGGIVAFHDIVADVFQRYGRPTPSVTGGVPTFWKELQPKFAETWEFVDDPEQDGFGIGVVRWQGTL
jgi:predicted O-methyltransferase YrrM